MRKIEKGMLEAIRERRNYHCANTAVLMRPDGVPRVMLHGSCIVEVRDAVVVFSMAGWGTVTTRSRINAVLEAFAQPGWKVLQRGGKQLVRRPGGSEDPLPVWSWQEVPRV